MSSNHEHHSQPCPWCPPVSSGADPTAVPFSHSPATDTGTGVGDPQATVDIFRSPRARITVGKWTSAWKEKLNVSSVTENHYHGTFQRYILPYWSATALMDITNRRVRMWARELHIGRGLAASTVDGTVRLFARLLAAAVTAGHLPNNPINPLPPRPHHPATTVDTATLEPREVLQIADQVAAIYGADGAMLIVTAAWTGARWGELVALRRPNLTLREDDTGVFRVAPEDGTLLESGTDVWLAAPKAERAIPLPPFLVRLLRAHLATHDHSHVFTTPERTVHRHDAFCRRALRPAADGNLTVDDPRIRLYPVKPGLRFHDFRHSYRAWIGDELDGYARRGGSGEGTADGSSATACAEDAPSEDQRRAALHDLWDDAVETLPQPSEDAWRRAAS